MNRQRVLLFDLGGVLVESSGHAALGQLLPKIDKGEIFARWHASKSVGLFERGSIAPADFADLLPNVVAARGVGINAFHVRGFCETESALRSLGLPDDSLRGLVIP